MRQSFYIMEYLAPTVFGGTMWAYVRTFQTKRAATAYARRMHWTTDQYRLKYHA